MLSTIIIVILAGVISYIIATMVMQYIRSGGSPWERLLATARDSATILSTKAIAIVSGALALVDQSADVLELPQIKDLIMSFMKPTWVAVGGAVIALIVYLSRRRTLR